MAAFCFAGHAPDGRSRSPPWYAPPTGHGDFLTPDGRPVQVPVSYVDFFLMSLVKPELIGSSMTAFALQGTHPSANQVAATMFRVELALMGSLWLLFALQGTLPTTEQVVARYADVFDVTLVELRSLGSQWLLFALQGTRPTVGPGHRHGMHLPASPGRSF